MKKVFLSIIALVISHCAFAQWTLPGTNINNTNSGNVGIGTALPASKLTVAGGDLQVENGQGRFKGWYNAGSGRAIEVGLSAGTGLIYNYDRTASTEGDLKFGGVTSGGISIKANSGNVGIGNTSPGSLLTVGSSTTRGTLNVIGAVSDPIPAITLTDSRSGANQYTLYNGGTGFGNFDIYDQSAGASRFTISPAGYVGIGITNPQAVLDARTSSGTASISAVSAASTGAQQFFAGLNDGTSPTIHALSFNTSAPSTQFGLNRAGMAGVYADGSNLTSLIMGTTGNVPLVFGTNNTESVRILASGNVGIGTTTPDEKLTVNGIIHSTQVKVTSTVPAPDYVFEPEYKLTELTELKDYLDKNHHLPEIPSAAQIEKDGINLGDMNMKLLKKVEELTLYILELDKQLKLQNDQINSLKNHQ